MSSSTGLRAVRSLRDDGSSTARPTSRGSSITSTGSHTARTEKKEDGIVNQITRPSSRGAVSTSIHASNRPSTATSDDSKVSIILGCLDIWMYGSRMISYHTAAYYNDSTQHCTANIITLSHANATVIAVVWVQEVGRLKELVEKEKR